MLVSPTEHHPLLRSLGLVSSEVEKYGVDFLFPTAAGLVGVQRKAVADLVASKRGGRLQKELVQMEALDHAVLLVEGQWGWTTTGHSRVVPSYTFAEYVGFQLSVQAHNILLFVTESVQGTAEALPRIERWFNKGEHGSLLRKPKARVPQALHILQHFDGISLSKSKAIYDHFGRVPLRWDCTKDEMKQVPGIGKVMVERLSQALGGMDG